ncbi:MAG: hypothetical protein AAF570_17760 [Bacteroidota bacterium]
MGSIFIGNFTPQHEKEAGSNPGTHPGKIGVTIIHKEDDQNAKLLTLPSGGAEVLLANWFPLYGIGEKSCYTPLMRMTSTRVDRAGNLWAINNWKPDAKIDLSDNPGGDGIVIFIGVAEGQGTVQPKR